jgi:molybdopterin molybdotransferase
VRVFTGAVVPPGADAVVMVERTREDAAAGTVTLDVAVRAGEHVRPRGQDLKRGASVLEPGARIDAAEIAALAAVGCTAPTVYRRPRVRVVSTGDELVEPGERPAAHQVRNSNGPMLLACLAELGIEGELLGNAPDEPRALAKLLRRASDGDALLISGGVSVGRYDLVRGALEDAGMRTLFHGVAMKPGKPVLAGLRDGCLVLGLPGNPVSSLAGFALLAAPALRRMMGYRRPDNVTLNARLERAIRTRPGRKTFHLARVESVAGELSACRAASTGSGDVLSMSRANGWIVSETDEGELAAGDRVPVMLWRDFHLRRHPG